MKIVVVPDSFKGSMSSRAVCEIVEEGVKSVFPEAEVVKVPIADGGEGLIDCLVYAMGGEIRKTVAKDPLMRPVEAKYAILPDGTAVVEMAEASGLMLVDGEQDILNSTSYGTGELIRAALDGGAKRIVLGIGGSATNDGGIGLAAALGVRFTDSFRNDIAPTPAGIAELAGVDASGLDKRLAERDIIVACDVSNKLLGAQGASAVFGPQKGADPEMVKVLEKLLEKYVTVIEEHMGRDIRNIKGTGAAGGIGVSLLAFCGAEMRQGIDVVMEAVRFQELLRGADLVITGEGRIDEQSIIGGKVPVGIAGRAKKAGIPVIALAGIIGKGLSDLGDTGIYAAFPTNIHGVPFEQACETCEKDLLFAAKSLMSAVKIGMNIK